MALKISLELRSFPGFSRSSPFSFLCSISQTRSYRQCVKKVDYQQRIQEHTKSFVRRLGYAAIIGTCGFSLYSYLKENGLSLEHWSVHAKESNDSKFRKQYSFIADVVEKVNNSVVLIECQGAGFFHTRGSGFIISKDGLIVTNAHVIANGTSGKVIVTLKDKRVFQAVIQKIDEYADLAILKIHCDGLPALPMGSVSDLRAGEWVVAIGSPLHLTNSVTVGVVSSPERHAREVGGLTDIKYIQTDASITHGNSGGPLVNLDGEAIGVNSLAIKPGIAFAVPVEHVKMLLDGSITESLKDFTLGVATVTLNPSLIEDLAQKGMYLPKYITGGLLIHNITEDSVAQMNGLQPGDVIFEVEGKPIKDLPQFLKMLSMKGKLRVRIYRSGGVFNVILVARRR